MPAIETEGVSGTFVHAHTFRFVSPAMTDKYNIPNPCTSCHHHKSTASGSGRHTSLAKALPLEADALSYGLKLVDSALARTRTVSSLHALKAIPKPFSRYPKSRRAYPLCKPAHLDGLGLRFAEKDANGQGTRQGC
jgi:hypothetical protein